LIYNRNADGTTAVYIDGVRAGGTQSDTLNYSTATDTIGRYYGGYWPGYWTNMRITIGTAVYNSTLTTQAIPREPLTSLANTKYLMLGSSVTTDSSGTQTVTNNNTVTISTLQPCPSSTPTPTPTNTATPTQTPTETETIGVLNFVAEVYNQSCQLIRTEVVSSGGINVSPLALTMFYIATAPVEGNVVMKLLSSTYDAAVAYPTITGQYYNSCPDAWTAFNG
jgi:hypothetical protein